MKRELIETIVARATQDGAGVSLNRVFGGERVERFDPFLMLDEFGSANPDDYIEGFPDHPHRGFTTISYMLEGQFEHRDHLGHVGAISDGGVQWMTAGRGVIHSEMPMQSEGRMRGFQLWLNLAAEDKMQPASYQNIESEQLTHINIKELQVTAISGRGIVNGHQVVANVQVPKTEALYWDLRNTGHQTLCVQIPVMDDRTCLIYVVDGHTDKGCAGQLLRYGASGDLVFELTGQSRVLLLSGKPLNEPIVQYGPFVMNSMTEIEQAIRDYQNGVLTD